MVSIRTSSKLINPFFKAMIREWRKKPQLGRKHLLIMYLIQDLYLEYVNSSCKLVRNSVFRKIGHMDKCLTKKDLWISSKCIQRCSLLLSRKMEIKTTVSYYYTTISMAKIQWTQQTGHFSPRYLPRCLFLGQIKHTSLQGLVCERL